MKSKIRNVSCTKSDHRINTASLDSQQWIKLKHSCREINFFSCDYHVTNNNVFSKLTGIIFHWNSLLINALIQRACVSHSVCPRDLHKHTVLVQEATFTAWLQWPISVTENNESSTWYIYNLQSEIFWQISHVSDVELSGQKPCIVL